MGGLSLLEVSWLLQPIPTIINPYFLIQTEVWVIGSPFGMLGRGVRVHQLLHQLSFSDCPKLPALTTVFPLVSQDWLGKPQPKGHPLRGRLPFIVWVHLHLPTHYCVSQSSPVSLLGVQACSLWTCFNAHLIREDFPSCHLAWHLIGHQHA